MAATGWQARTDRLSIAPELGRTDVTLERTAGGYAIGTHDNILPRRGRGVMMLFTGWLLQSIRLATVDGLSLGYSPVHDDSIGPSQK
jgi:hypothetical protein